MAQDTKGVKEQEIPPVSSMGSLMGLTSTLEVVRRIGLMSCRLVHFLLHPKSCVAPIVDIGTLHPDPPHNNQSHLQLT